MHEKNAVALRSQPVLKGAVKAWHSVKVLESEALAYAVEFSPDGQRLAYTYLGTREFRMALWALTPAPRRLVDIELNSYAADVEALAFSADSQFLAVASRDGTLRLLRADSGVPCAESRSLHAWTSVAFRDDGQFLAAGDSSGNVTLMTAQALTVLHSWQVHSAQVSGLVFAKNRMISGSWDGKIAVVEPPFSNDSKPTYFGESMGSVNDLALDSSGETLVVATSDQPLKRTPELYLAEKKGAIVFPNARDAIHLFRLADGHKLAHVSSHQGSVSTAALSPDGETLVSGGWDKRLWAMSSHHVKGFSREYGWLVRRVRVSNDGRYVAVAAWAAPKSWNASAPPVSVELLEWEYESK